MKILKTKTKDGIYLSGILCEAESTKKIIIHIHGMSGDIYSNSFYNSMYNKYPKNGISFLAVENRGTHSITQFNSDEGIVNIGNSYEIFEESKFDIEAWINKAIEMGYSEIWLQSHSLGPSKVAYYINNNNNDNIKGLIFLSPADIIGLRNEPNTINEHDVNIKEALELVKNGKGEQLLSNKLWGNILSAKTYLSLFSSNSNTAIFNFYDEKNDFNVIKKIKIPVIAFSGTKDDAIVPVIDPYKAMEILEKNLINSPRIKTIVYTDANHDFYGFGDNITDEVIKFIIN